MEDYDSLLEDAYKKVKVVEKHSERFEVPLVKGAISGKNTIINNIIPIADYLRRPVEHLSKFLQRELATSGKLENTRLILKTKLSSEKVNKKIQEYTTEFVICNECKKPDTEIESEKGIKYKKCLACKAVSPIRTKL
ncbi:translation initiation factor IF-2 subunit beta [Candidatus Pacearchaeota archaeon CG10_big_fil_rev_8_21_14_0_10_31_24]|nr:MAG: translation initiation factor IF-2 subunit beta [Candidatus Pacearchaeota archaeon CG10_big_fil_rev_8_21_14_0_10_31_24]